MEEPAPLPPPDDGTARATAHFAERPDAELFYLAQHAARYPPAVGAAAVAELQRRALVPVPAAPGPPPAPAPPAPAAGWGPALRALLPSRRFWATPLLLGLNAAVWAAMTASGVSATDPTGHELARWGSNVSSLTLPGQPWRLLTSVFVHAGATHLLLNGFSLWLLGVLLEARVGAARLLAVYLASGAAGSLATLWYHRGGINSVGASGAIFGLYGLLLTLLLSKQLVLDKFDRRAMLGLVLYLVLSNLISGLSGNVDNAAHLGGLLMGGLVAAPLALVGLKPVTE
ncbi:rhomboid family intramembrane serine protease [Hymenobacter caeli]|uniref:Rhomboid protease GluP n=1 Tax=Hymenobacter caeli TaxID=2735894 RepID=A0ABX2FS89_9BACT|nr:rhomboid family intramembrane serine protease [Hymenobacter caeli]NRT20055.1 rhomboid protease GluP [Hymenobacter caeli]